MNNCLTVRKRYMISWETTIRIGHGEVFLKESQFRILSKCWKDISDGVYCYLTWMSFTRVLIGFAEKSKRSSGGVSFRQENSLQLCNFAHNVLSQKKKTMVKFRNRNTRKRYLLISKITLKTSERCHLTTKYLPEVTV